MNLRVAVFSDSVLPVLNGVSVSISSLVTELRDRGHSVHIYCPRFPRHRETDPNTFRFRSMETPWTKGYPFAYPPYYRMLLKFRRRSYDLIHIHTPGLVGMVGLRWAESHGIPAVATYHTLYDRYSHYIPFFPRRYIRYRIAKHTNFFFNHVDHVITPSEAALKWLRRHSVSTPATVIPTGAPSRRMIDRSEARHELKAPPHQRILLYVGRLAKEKNLETLFAMAARVFAQDESLRLWLVGDGPYREQCQSIVRALGIGDRVRFFGFVPREDVDRFYAAADLFVFSSITETQGLVVQEAMTYGLAAVAVAGGGASAGIDDGENGLVVRDDPAAFAQAVLDLLCDERRWAALSEGAARSARQYGIGETCQQVVRVYESVVRRGPGMEAHAGARAI